MAAIMATTYRPYLGVGLGPLSVCNKHTHFFVTYNAQISFSFQQYFKLAMKYVTINFIGFLK
jgi:hypothetical protein